MDAGFDVYVSYIKTCMQIHHGIGIPFDKIDEVLNQVDKESGRTLEEK